MNTSLYMIMFKDLLVHYVFVITSILCTGDNVLERVSLRVIVLSPPEKLVLETRASGGYQWLEWDRNGNHFRTAENTLSLSPFIITLQEFSNFFEIYVRDNTTVNDLGVYEVDLILGTGAQVPEVDFTVTPYSEYVYVTVCVFEPMFQSLPSHICAQRQTKK